MKKMITVLLSFALAVVMISSTVIGAHPIGSISTSLSMSGTTACGSSSATATNKYAAGTLTVTVKASKNASLNGDVYVKRSYAATDSRERSNSCSASATVKNTYNLNFWSAYVNGTYTNSMGSIGSTKTIKKI